MLRPFINKLNQYLRISLCKKIKKCINLSDTAKKKSQKKQNYRILINFDSLLKDLETAIIKRFLTFFRYYGQ